MDNRMKQITDKLIHTQSTEISQSISDKLKQSRQLALQKTKKKWSVSSFWVMPATALAAIAAYVVFPLALTSVNTDNLNNTALITDLEVIEQLDLAEDLEFYEWLSSEENLSSI